MAAILEGWQSTQRQRDDGTIDSLQSARMSAPVVPMSEEGAARLGRAYWQAVETSTGHLIRARERPDGLELRLLARDPVLLAFGPPELRAANGQVSCRYPIRGGILARREAGAITLAQTGEDAVVLTSSLTGFEARLAAPPGRPPWTGTLYQHVQARIHVAISRRYFSRLARIRP